MPSNATTNSFWGFHYEDDTKREEKTYFIGSENQMPIALFLLLHSGMTQATARYCSMLTYTEEACEWANKFDQKTNFEIAETLGEQFDEHESTYFTDPVTKHYISHPEQRQENYRLMQEAINNQDRNIILPLNLYSGQFAKHFAQKTADFNCLSQGVVLTCPPSYMGYWNRAEFAQPDKAINMALEMIMDDLLRILQLKQMEFNPHNMTITAPGFKAQKFVKSYGW